MLQEGTVFAGRYRVMRSIAQGGMGAVYEVVHIETERRRALKVMHSHILQSELMRERFKLEAKIAAHIESDFIVDVFDAGIDETSQMPFLVMELLRGEELGKRLKRLGRLPPDEVVMHLYQAALALDKTHKASIVHRDLKPENLFLAEREDSAPRIKVLDFGIAKIVAESATNGGPTQSIGTPLYMSPEQFNPAAKLTAASDIYALGMIAYTLLTGVTYWFEEAKGGNIFAIASVAVHGPPQPATFRAAARRVVLPPSFDLWFARATAPNPAYRFPAATVAVRALAEVFGVPLPSEGISLGRSGISYPESGGPESIPHRRVLASDPALLPPPASYPAAYAAPASAPLPAHAPGLPAGDDLCPPPVQAPPALHTAQGPGRIPLQTPGTVMVSDRAAGMPEASTRAPPPPSGPATTSLGASMTRQVPQKRGKATLIALPLAVTALGAGSAVLYALHSRRPPFPTAADEHMQAASPPPPTQGAPSPMTVPASALPAAATTAQPAASAAPRQTTVEQSKADVQKGASQKAGDKVVPLASVKASPALSASASSPPKSKYTQE